MNDITESADETEWTVVVPIRTQQTFVVTARSARAAKTQVRRWLEGLQTDAEPIDDLAQAALWPLPNRWLIQRAD